MPINYHSHLVILPYLIALLSSYLGLDIVGHLRTPDSRWSFFWMLVGGMITGISIWAVNIIGILAFKSLPVIKLDLLFTALSLITAIGVCLWGYFLIKHKTYTIIRYLAGGIPLGFGIAAIYYIGIFSLHRDFKITLIPSFFILSLLFCIIAVEITLWLAVKSNLGDFKKQIKWKIFAAFIIGTAIYVMHFLSIRAVTLTPKLIQTISSINHLNQYLLPVYITEVILFVIAIALMVSTIKQATNVGLEKQNKALLAAEEKLRLRDRALDASPDAIMICDSLKKDFPIIYVNSAYTKITGYSAEESLGRNCRFLQRNDRDQPELEKLRNILKSHQSGEVFLRNYRKDGNLFWNELHVAPVTNSQGTVTHYVGVIIDFTKRKLLEDQLVHQAMHDILTHLPNRTLLLDHIQQAINSAKRSGSLVALLFFDIDRFKLINDSLSHKAGDEVLKAVAQRLSESVRNVDTVARLGGDEFVIVLKDVPDKETIATVAKKCQKSLKPFFMINHHQFTLTASIGISIFPENGEDAETLLKNADTAMYWAKEAGGDNFQFYIADIVEKKYHLQFEEDLRQALNRGEFVLHYQPFLDLTSEKICGVEALLRWNYPKIGLLYPHDFLFLAEDMGLMPAIGEWVMRTACKQNKTWQDNGLPSIKMAVNLSGKQLKNYSVTKIAGEILQETGLDPETLELELTENIIMHNQERILSELKKLAEMNISLVIDDFGIGYSSLASIKELPVNKIKIDRIFIRNVVSHLSDASIVIAIIAMAKTLGMTVIAEGVETKEQLMFLKSKHCDQAQGFYFSPAVTAEKFAKLLKENRQWGFD